MIDLSFINVIKTYYKVRPRPSTKPIVLVQHRNCSKFNRVKVKCIHHKMYCYVYISLRFNFNHRRVVTVVTEWRYWCWSALTLCCRRSATDATFPCELWETQKCHSAKLPRPLGPFAYLSVGSARSLCSLASGEAPPVHIPHGQLKWKYKPTPWCPCRAQCCAWWKSGMSVDKSMNCSTVWTVVLSNGPMTCKGEENHG